MNPPDFLRHTLGTVSLPRSESDNLILDSNLITSQAANLILYYQMDCFLTLLLLKV